MTIGLCAATALEADLQPNMTAAKQLLPLSSVGAKCDISCDRGAMPEQNGVIE